jgi:hypothetical protein
MSCQRTSLALLLALGLAACALPAGDRDSPEGVHYAALQARTDGDLEALWELLHPEVQARFDRWLAAEKQAVGQIELLYPDRDRPAALAALADGKRASLRDGQELFEALMGETDEQPLGLWVELGARVRSSTLAEGGGASIRTWAGDEIPLRQLDDGQWSLVPTAAELARLDAAVARAQENLEQVKRNIAVLKGETP